MHIGIFYFTGTGNTAFVANELKAAKEAFYGIND